MENFQKLNKVTGYKIQLVYDKLLKNFLLWKPFKNI